MSYGAMAHAPSSSGSRRSSSATTGTRSVNSVPRRQQDRPPHSSSSRGSSPKGSDEGEYYDDGFEDEGPKQYQNDWPQSEKEAHENEDDNALVPAGPFEATLSALAASGAGSPSLFLSTRPRPSSLDEYISEPRHRNVPFYVYQCSPRLGRPQLLQKAMIGYRESVRSEAETAKMKWELHVLRIAEKLREKRNRSPRPFRPPSSSVKGTSPRKEQTSDAANKAPTPTRMSRKKEALLIRRLCAAHVHPAPPPEPSMKSEKAAKRKRVSLEAFNRRFYTMEVMQHERAREAARARYIRRRHGADDRSTSPRNQKAKDEGSSVDSSGRPVTPEGKIVKQAIKAALAAHSGGSPECAEPKQNENGQEGKNKELKEAKTKEEELIERLTTQDIQHRAALNEKLIRKRVPEPPPSPRVPLGEIRRRLCDQPSKHLARTMLKLEQKEEEEFRRRNIHYKKTTTPQQWDDIISRIAHRKGEQHYR